ncbi:hypothetical protein ACTXT7_013424, partial [Hymenolepis weldensis]
MNKHQRVTCCFSLRSRKLQAPNHNWRREADPLQQCQAQKTVAKWLSRGSKPIPQSRQFGTAPEKDSF